MGYMMVQHYKNAVGATAPFRAATIKGLATHTADEAGPAAGPDYGYGWGLMNTKSAAALITLHAASGTALRNIKQTVLSNSDLIEFPVRAAGGGALKVTICWTDPAGTVATKAVDANTASLVNDLDLRLITGGTTHFPWKLNPASPTSSATNSGDNDRDNVEQVYVASPTVGQSFTVRVMHKGTLKNAAGATATQPVSIIISVIFIDIDDITLGNPTEYVYTDLDLNSDGLADLTFQTGRSDLVCFSTVGGGVAGIPTVPPNQNHFAAAFSYGAILGVSLPTESLYRWNEGYSGMLSCRDAGCLGLWEDKTAYLGVQFSTATGIHYGWVEVFVFGNTSTGSILSFAYESEPSRPIVAGQIPAVVVAKAFSNCE
jgi:hypothetical protein